jgi:histidine triad (HIT) family protein
MSISKKLFSLAKTPLGDLIVGIAFGKFSKLLPVKRIKETTKVIAFWHPKPFWEKHILIIPKKQIKNITSLKYEDGEYLYEVFKVAGEIINELGWEKEGYSLLANGGKRQEVNQLHFHLHSGKQIQ